MSLTNAEKLKILKEYQLKEGDTGSSDVQIALLTANIDKLTEHFKTHKHDHHSRRGLLRHVSLRRKLLSYLKDTDIKRYRELVTRLGIRG